MMSLRDDLVKKLGNWEPCVFDKAYSSKIPLEAMRAAGEYTEGVFYCPRSVVVTDTLEQLEALLWDWVEPAIEILEEKYRATGSSDNVMTAFVFLTFMKKLKRVVLQDAAYMMEFHPERKHHPVLSLPIFHCDLFLRFQTEMKVACEAMVSPADSAMEHALPGVLQSLRAQSQKTELVLQMQRNLSAEMRERLDAVASALGGHTLGFRQQMGDAFRAAGDVFLASPSSQRGQEVGDSPEDSSISLLQTQLTGPVAMANNQLTTLSSDGVPYPGYGYEPDWQGLGSVRQIYDQWHGYGIYKNKPIPGGIFAMILKEGRKNWRPWCKNGTKNRRFSRMKSIMDQHRIIREQLGLTPERTCVMMQRGMDLKKSFSAFADAVNKVPWHELYGEMPENENAADGEDAMEGYENAADGEDAMEGYVGEEEVATVSEESSDCGVYEI